MDVVVPLLACVGAARLARLAITCARSWLARLGRALASLEQPALVEAPPAKRRGPIGVVP